MLSVERHLRMFHHFVAYALNSRVAPIWFRSNAQKGKGSALKTTQLVSLGPGTQSKLTIDDAYVPNGKVFTKWEVVSLPALEFWMVFFMVTPKQSLGQDSGTCQERVSRESAESQSRFRDIHDMLPVGMSLSLFGRFRYVASISEYLVKYLCQAYYTSYFTTAATASIRQYSRFTVYTATSTVMAVTPSPY